MRKKKPRIIEDVFDGLLEEEDPFDGMFAIPKSISLPPKRDIFGDVVEKVEKIPKMPMWPV